MPSPAASVEARAVMIDTAAQPPFDGTAAAGVATAVIASAPATPAIAKAAMRRTRRGSEDGCMGDSLLVGAERPLPPAGGFPLAVGCSGRPAVSHGRTRRIATCLS